MLLLYITKQNATYWLGLAAFERGSYDVAIDYFGKRLAQRYPKSIWESAALYNLARSHEAVAMQDDNADQWQKALEVYLSVDESPWTPACRLRAHHIKQRLGIESEPVAGESSEDAPEG